MTYSTISATVQSGLKEALLELGAKHGAELHITEGSVLRIQARLPSNRVEDFISDVNLAACGRIKWLV